MRPEPASRAGAATREVLDATVNGRPWQRDALERAQPVGGAGRAAGLRASRLAFGLKPHLSYSFKLSTDPHFVARVRDVVGLYLDRHIARRYPG